MSVKRAFDVVCSLLGLLLLWPILILLYGLVRVNLGAPVLFKQQRPGLHGRPFMMIKFRTMLDCMGGDGKPLPDHIRLTRFGRLLRASSLDELPELWNVIKGDMSLVGPRPLLMEYMPLYSVEQARRHNVRPGITGWAQVNGRNALTWPEKFILDIWYVDNRSFWLDVKILLLTIKKVFLREDVSADGQATMSKFTGEKKVKSLAILGASGHGKVVADLAELCGWSISFFDDAFPELRRNGGWNVEGCTDDLFRQVERFSGVIVAIGHNRTRLTKLKQLRNAGFAVVTLVHPQASVSRYATLESGCVVFAGAVINAFAQLGEGCILNTSCSVDHDCLLGSGVHVSPGANLAGSVVVGEATWIGVGASVRQLVRIGADVIVGAGAAVVNEIPNNVTVVGVPARSI